MKDVLVLLFTYDRFPLIKQSLDSMFNNPGANFRLWVVDNGSFFSSLYGDNSGEKQFNYLLDLYKQGRIEKLLLEKVNYGIHYPLNELLSLAKLTSVIPTINRPDYIMTTNDDLIYEDNWLTECIKTYEDLRFKNVGIVSGFHMFHLSGGIASGMETFEKVDVGNRTYELKRNVTNSWFMAADTFLDVMDFFETDHPTENGDWKKLDIIRNLGMICAITPKEMLHHSPDAQGKGKWNRLNHW